MSWERIPLLAASITAPNCYSCFKGFFAPVFDWLLPRRITVVTVSALFHSAFVAPNEVPVAKWKFEPRSGSPNPDRFGDKLAESHLPVQADLSSAAKARASPSDYGEELDKTVD